MLQTGRSYQEVEQQKSRIASYFTQKPDIDLVLAAIAFAIRKHEGETRDEGSAYIHHPLSVALIILDEFGVVDRDITIIAVLHDTAEKLGGLPVVDTLGEIGEIFGQPISDRISILSKKVGGNRRERDIYYMLAILSSDFLVRIVKIADRIHNVRSLKCNPDKDKVERYLFESREQILPIASATSRIGFSLLSLAISEVASATAK
jgi:GTP diphosphokinase / guanosine-3',5'-bis(diphosphate) 3'-diphosphatase